MRIRVQIIFLTVLVLVSFSMMFRAVYGQSVTEYMIHIRPDGSASWSIQQTGMETQVNFDTEFVHKILSLVETAESLTERNMTANKISSTQNVSGSYVTVEYRFEWINFSKLENTSIVIGDVFEVDDFFLRLYGDGKLFLSYPSEYVVEAVLPEPSERNDSNHLLSWWGTNDLERDTTTILLRKKNASLGLIDLFGQNVILIIGLTMVASGISLSFYALRYRRKNEKTVEKPKIFDILQMESDEDKIVKLLMSSGGNMPQSAIVKQSEFSKAKVSQLLAALEGKGTVKRFKRGRDKIVVLAEQIKN